MSFLFVGSTGDNAGQSLFTWALAKRFTQKGASVGFLKPFGSNRVKIDGRWVDRDAILFKDFLNLDVPLDTLCPHPFVEDDIKEPQKILERIEAVAHELSVEKDIILVMGCSHIFFDKNMNNVNDISIVNRLNADFILVNRYYSVSSSLYSIFSVCSMLERTSGILINRVPEADMREVEEKMAPLLKAKGLPVTAVVPEKAALSLLSVEEIRRRLAGEILSGKGKLEGPVTGMTVGSSDLSDELRIFKRVYNKIILLGPHDKALGVGNSHVTRPIAGIVITGGIKPAQKISDLAEKNAIPLILAKNDTFSALNLLDKTSSSLSAKDESKLDHFIELLDKTEAFENLLHLPIV